MIPLRRIIKSFSSSGGVHKIQTPVYAPKVTEKLIWIHLYNSGTFERIPAFIGESLLQALNRFKVNNIYGECNGGEELFSMREKVIDKNTMGPLCNGCRVNIHEPWLNKLKEKHYLEEKQIDSSFFESDEQTRLACCIVLEKWMDNIIITVPENEQTIQ